MTGCTDTVAAACRRFLLETLDSDAKVVVTPELDAELAQHQSRFARTWRVSMEARRRVLRHSLSQASPLRTKVEALPKVDPCRAELQKDMHLIESALAMGASIATLDRRLVDCVTTKAAALRQLRSVRWVALPGI